MVGMRKILAFIFFLPYLIIVRNEGNIPDKQLLLQVNLRKEK